MSYNIFEAINVVSDLGCPREELLKVTGFENLHNFALKRANSECTFRNIMGSGNAYRMYKLVKESLT